MLENTGLMVNSVKNSASPISTTLGGVCCVPIAERRKENVTIYRVKDVVITSREGSKVMAVVRNRI